MGKTKPMVEIVGVRLPGVENLPLRDLQLGERFRGREVKLRGLGKSSIGRAAVDDEPLRPVWLGRPEHSIHSLWLKGEGHHAQSVHSIDEGYIVGIGTA
jgi:hypothetical protein